jgi:hypothetical protein
MYPLAPLFLFFVLLVNEQLTFLLLPPHCLHCYSNEGAQFIFSHSIIKKNRDRRQRREKKRRRMQSMLEAKNGNVFGWGKEKKCTQNNDKLIKSYDEKDHARSAQ